MDSTSDSVLDLKVVDSDKLLLFDWDLFPFKLFGMTIVISGRLSGVFSCGGWIGLLLYGWGRYAIGLIAVLCVLSVYLMNVMDSLRNDLHFYICMIITKMNRINGNK